MTSLYRSVDEQRMRVRRSIFNVQPASFCGVCPQVQASLVNIRKDPEGPKPILSCLDAGRSCVECAVGTGNHLSSSRSLLTRSGKLQPKSMCPIMICKTACARGESVLIADMCVDFLQAASEPSTGALSLPLHPPPPT